MKHRLVVQEGEGWLVPEPWIEGYMTIHESQSEQEAVGAWIAREMRARAAFAELSAYVEAKGLQVAASEGDHTQNRGQ